MIFFLVPFSRPEMARQVVSTFERQTIPVLPVIVANGCRFSAVGNSFVIHLERKDLGDALAVGLDAIRKMASPGDWFAKIDDDDWYAPDYAEKIASVAEAGADWSGFPRVRARLQSGTLVEFGDGSNSISAGGTLAARVDKACDFQPMPSGYGEDAQWCRDMASAGHVFVPRGPEGYIWQRREGSAFPFSDSQFLWFRNCIDPLTKAPILPSGEPPGIV